MRKPHYLRNGGLCLSCEDFITEDELAYTEPKIGAWHEDCPTPRNLHVYIRERDRTPAQKRADTRKRNRQLNELGYLYDTDDDFLL